MQNNGQLTKKIYCVFFFRSLYEAINEMRRAFCLLKKRTIMNFKNVALGACALAVLSLSCGKKNSKSENSVAPAKPETSQILDVKVSNYQIALNKMKEACNSWLTSFGTQEISFTFTNAFLAEQNTSGTYKGLNCITNSEQIYLQISRISGSGTPYDFSFVLAPDEAAANYEFKKAETGDCASKANAAFIDSFASQFTAISSEFRESVRQSVEQSFCPTQAEILKKKIFELVSAK
jgi:hypothetical protein